MVTAITNSVRKTEQNSELGGHILQSVTLSFSHSTAGKKSAEEAKQNN